jgi:uncharacterized membrane protein
MADETKKKKGTTGLDRNVAAMLSYLLGWVTGLIFWATEKDKFVRFHAMQSIIFSLIITVLIFFFWNFILVFGVFFSWLIEIAGFAIWIVLMVKAYNGEEYKLPWIGKAVKKIVKDNA